VSALVGPRLAPGSKVGAYTIEHGLGAGGFGVVYAARDPSGAQVALKHLAGVVSVPPRSTEAFLARFRREARISRTLVHPGIVELRDHGVEEGVPYMVLRLLTGRDLEAYVKDLGPLDPPGVVTLAIEACAALAHAHDNGVIHRDLKPANLFLDTKDGGALRTVVCDFGIAKTLDDDGESLTETGALLGTALYMSPEQLVDAGRVDMRSDVWSLCMTLYTALAGRAAFEHVDTWTELVVKLATEGVPSLHTHAPWVPAGLARIVHAGLLRDPDARFPSMRALGDALAGTGLGGPELALTPARRSVVVPPFTLPSHTNELGSGRRIGPYRLGAKLGAGGMGEVFAATGARGEALAVKVLRAPEDPLHRRRFAREIEAIAKIESPFVARLVDHGGAEEGAPYLAMERLVGRDLGDLVSANGPLREGPLVRLFVQACEGLAAAHALGIVHRDLKPSNLFLSEPEPGGELVMKVCDFGIAKRRSPDALASTELTQHGALLGSPAYMSPEQAKNADDVDARADVYGLALSLHEGLAGSRPWPGKKTVGELIVAVCTEDLPRLSALAPWVSPGLAAVVERALRRDRDERFATVADLAAALTPFAASAATFASFAPLSAEERALPLAASPVDATARGSTGGPEPMATSVAPTAGRVPRRAAAAVAVASLAIAAALAVAAMPADKTAGGAPLAPTSAPSPTLPGASPPSAPAPTPSVAAPVPSTSSLAGRSAAHPPRADAGAVVASHDAGAATSPSNRALGRGFTATELPLGPSAAP